MRLVGGSSFQIFDVKTEALGGGVISHGPGNSAIPPEGPLAGINHLVLGEEVEHLRNRLQKIRSVNNFHKNQSIISCCLNVTDHVDLLAVVSVHLILIK